MRHQQNILAPWAPDDLILGMSAFYHDSSVALVNGSGDILYASLEERYSKIKHDASFPKNALEDGLQQCQLSLANVRALYFYEKPLLRLFLMLRAVGMFYPWSFSYFYESFYAFFVQYRAMFAYLKNNGFTGQIYYLDHHTSHASLFFLSNFQQA